MYPPESIPLRPNVDLGQPLPDQEHWLKVYRWDFRYYNFHLPYTEDLHGYDLRRAIAEYYGLMTWVDDCVGRMLAALEQNGLAENTIVVFTSDHGDYLGSHGRGAERRPARRVDPHPAAGALAGPAAPRLLVRAGAGLVDLAPTLLDLIGADLPAHMHGRSLAAMLRGEGETNADSWAIIETGSGVGVRTLTHLYGLPFHGEARQLAPGSPLLLRPAGRSLPTSQPGRKRRAGGRRPRVGCPAEGLGSTDTVDGLRRIIGEEIIWNSSPTSPATPPNPQPTSAGCWISMPWRWSPGWRKPRGAG